MAPALFGVLRRQEDLRDGDGVDRERLLIGVREADLAGRGGGLLFLEPQPVAEKPEMAPADGDRARRHEDHLLPLFPATRHILGEGGEPRRANLAALGDEERGADLDDEPARRAERIGRTRLRGRRRPPPSCPQTVRPYRFHLPQDLPSSRRRPGPRSAIDTGLRRYDKKGSARALITPPFRSRAAPPRPSRGSG